MGNDAAAINAELRKKFGLPTNGHTSLAPPALSPPETSPELTGPKPLSFGSWQLEVGIAIRLLLGAIPEKMREAIATGPVEKSIDQLSTQILIAISNHSGQVGRVPEELSQTDVEEEVRRLAEHAVTRFREAYLPTTVEEPGLPTVGELPVETFDEAVAANERYLERKPVIEGLCYSAAASMITGGKHSGKSTLARWQAICVAKGIEFLGRQVQQGPVIYLASEDEEMVARSELMRLGWTKDDPLYFVGKSQIPDDLDEEAVLQLLAGLIHKRGAVLCIVDMLFDFIPVRDELGYAETRKAVGMIQDVASRTSTHLTVLHHAPKHMPLSADAAVAALGSQGLAARVSPMILTGRHGPGVHSIVSTSVRDPRGKPIKHTRLLLLDDGSMAMGGGFKAYMLAEVYSERVMELIEGELGQEFTVADVMERVGIDYEPARATLKLLHEAGRIVRAGQGKKRSPFRYYVPLTEISAAEGGGAGIPDPSPIVHGGKPEEQTLEEQGRFGYKENYSNPDDLDEYGISKSK